MCRAVSRMRPHGPLNLSDKVRHWIKRVVAPVQVSGPHDVDEVGPWFIRPVAVSVDPVAIVE